MINENKELKKILLSDINIPRDDDEVVLKQSGDKKYNIVVQATTFDDPDRMRDKIDKNAFNKCVKRINDGDRLKILLNHKGDMPLGNWTKAVKNDYGIKLYGFISEAATYTKEVLELIREKVYDKVSIGFIINKADSLSTGGLYIKQAEMLECSVVSVPANNNANILSVKSYNDLWKGDNSELSDEEQERIDTKAYNNHKRELNEIIAESYKITI